MQDGIYHVTFSSNVNDLGEGIVVFKGNSVNGGDYGYLYTGTKTDDSPRFSSRLTIKQWNPAAQSVFGPRKEFVLNLSGVSSGSGFEAQGSVEGQSHLTVIARGRYLSAAA